MKLLENMRRNFFQDAYFSGRSAYWDNIKGLLILLVVFGHFLFGLQNSPLINTIVDCIYFFHMPVFVFVSGYFSKSDHSRSSSSLWKLFSAFLILHGWFILTKVSPAGSVRLLESYHSEWYLLALIVWRLTIPYLSKTKGILPISVIVALLIGFFSAGGNETFAFNKYITFLPFFVAGYQFPASAWNRIKSRAMVTKLLICLCSFAASAGIIYFGLTRLQINDRDLLACEYQSVNLAEPASRLAIFVAAFLAMSFLLNAAPEKRIPLLTTAGRNSLSIYLLHRPVTLLFYNLVFHYSPVVQIGLSCAATFVLAVVFGSDRVSGFVNHVLDRATALLSRNGKTFKNQHLFRTLFYTILWMCLLYPLAISLIIHADQLWPSRETKTVLAAGNTTNEEKDPKYRVMSSGEKKNFDGALRLLFAGDLILLEDQVRNAYTGEAYDFSSCFSYAADYIASADYAIGVFEGPLGGTVRNYSSSNYADGKELYLNFPDEWGKAVSDAGFDLVTTANNHMMDMGVEGLLRTQDVLEEIRLDYTGTYRSKEDKEKNRLKIVELDGIKIAILSYTMFVNNVEEDTLIDGDFSWITSMIVPADSHNFEKVKKSVEMDFEKAISYHPDLVIVMPHWGTQFADYPDSDQLVWADIFKKCGADIILGDHTHTVQPVTMEDNTFTLFCPGNYANVFREYNGDCSALVEVYIDREHKNVIGGAVIPMWVSSAYRGNYRPIPIYSILTDPELGKTVTTYDMERVAEVYKHITGIMLGRSIDISMIQPRLYFDAEGFMRTKTPSLKLNDKMLESKAYTLLNKAAKVCFVGDSVTDGTKNGGVPWYEPLSDLIEGETVNCGWGSSTTKSLLRDHLQEIVDADADLYVIAIGTNDVRYRNDDCSMTPEEYTNTLSVLRAAIKDRNPDAEFIFVAPWTSTDGDRISALPYREKIEMNTAYSETLKLWTAETGDLFVNANSTIDEYLNHFPQSEYLVDYIHPNATKGVELYAQAFLLG